jgi:hypothetical protein
MQHRIAVAGCASAICSAMGEPLARDPLFHDPQQRPLGCFCFPGQNRLGYGIKNQDVLVPVTRHLIRGCLAQLVDGDGRSIQGNDPPGPSL